MREKRTIADACFDRFHLVDEAGHELIVDRLGKYEASTRNASLT
jgi:hypothetical protein